MWRLERTCSGDMYAGVPISSPDIVITGLFGLLAGNPAATINQTRGSFYLNPIGGLIKPKLNGKTIKESVKLNSKDQLQVGGLKMQFHLDANLSSN